MLTVTQRLMSGLGQAGSDWAWSVSILDTSYSGPDPIVVSSSTEQVTEPKTTHDHSSDTSALQDLYDYYNENIR